MAENPTISIAPIKGEEFTKRLFTPFHKRARLQDENEQGLPHDVTFDIRPGHYGYFR